MSEADLELIETTARQVMERTGNGAISDPATGRSYPASAEAIRCWRAVLAAPAEIRRLRAGLVAPVEGTCRLDGCDQPATTTAVGRERDHTCPLPYCDVHASVVADEGGPQYVESCPNCGCQFGFN